MRNRITILTLIIISLSLSGCSEAQKKGTGGALLGGIAGGIIGHQTGSRDKGILVGTLAGGALGYLIGNEQDKAKLEKQYPKGHREKDCEVKTWVPGKTKREWVAPVRETRYSNDGEPYQVIVKEGYYEEENVEGHWELRKCDAWVVDEN